MKASSWSPDPVVRAGHLDRPAHLLQARPGARADAVAERIAFALLPCSGRGVREATK